MNKMNKMAVIVLLAIGNMFFTACSKDGDNGTSNEKKLIIGTWIDRNHFTDAEWTFSSSGQLTLNWSGTDEHGTWSYEPSTHMLYRDFSWNSNTIHYSDIIQSITSEHMVTIGMDGNITNFSKKN